MEESAETERGMRTKHRRETAKDCGNVEGASEVVRRTLRASRN